MNKTVIDNIYERCYYYKIIFVVSIIIGSPLGGLPAIRRI
jgi:hypothetical protein